MATTRTFMLPKLALALVVAATLGACELEKPAMPTYARDVRPIFLSHCIRCHGAGGTLQGDDPVYPLGTPPDGYMSGAPTTCHLNVYGNQGDCVAPDGGVVDPDSCQLGAHACVLPIGPGDPTSWFDVYVFGKQRLMPPPPSPALTDWEMDVVRRWAANPLP